MDKRYYSVQEISEIYGIKKNTLYSMTKPSSSYHEFKAMCVKRFGRKVIIDREEFDKFINRKPTDER